MNRKGMRDLPRLRRMSRPIPKRREQVVRELAHLEHERTRLERELQMWRDNAARTEARLLEVDQRLAQMHTALAPIAPATPPPTADEQPRRGNWRDVRVEY